MKFNELTEYLAEEEGLKEQLSIAQIKEVTRLTLHKLAQLPVEEILNLLRRYQTLQDV